MHLPNTSTCYGTIQVGIGNPSCISRRRTRTATFAALSEINAQILCRRYKGTKIDVAFGHGRLRLGFVVGELHCASPGIMNMCLGCWGYCCCTRYQVLDTLISELWYEYEALVYWLSGTVPGR